MDKKLQLHYSGNKSRVIRMQSHAKMKADAEARMKADAEARMKADADVKTKVEMRATMREKIKAEHDEIIKANAEARMKAGAEAKMKAGAEAKMEATVKADVNTISTKYNPLVVMPTYNRSQNIDASIAMMQKQTIHDWTFLIIDDGSTMENKVIFQSLKDKYNDNNKIIFMENETNKHIAFTLNRGIQVFIRHQFLHTFYMDI